MNIQEKKQLYEAIMLDVAKVVKRHILEMYKEPNGYEKILHWIDSINKDLDTKRDDTLQESLESNFINNMNKFIRDNLTKYSKNANAFVRVTPRVRYVHFQMPAGPMNLTDVIISEPNQNIYVPIITNFMKRRNYSLVFFVICDQRLHIVYTDNDAVKVNFNDLHNNSDFDGSIYHLTNRDNAETIVRNGFKLSDRNNIYGVSYSPRIYFFTTRKSALDYRSTIEIEHDTKSLALVSVPIKSIKDIDFFYDPLTEEAEGIYTETKLDNIDNIKIEELN